MTITYSTLLSSTPLMVAETAFEYKYLTERHIQAMWFEQKYFKNLTTSSGETIEVISPGIWNAEAGPDFLKAHLKIGSKEYHGDIEIHFVDENWHNHQHDTDDRYNSVILHISLWKPKELKPLITKNGRPIILAHLESFLTLPHARIVQLIDLDLYPYKKFVGSGKCARTLFRTLPDEKVTALFKGAADWRLSQKRAYLLAHSEIPAVQLGTGMAMALGYKNNAESFLQLFLFLQSLKLSSENEYLTLAMLSCGFFDAAYERKWKDSQKYCQLLELSTTLPQQTIPRFKLVLNQIRPLNNPIRRLVFLSKFLSNLSLDALHRRFIHVWQSQWPHCKTKKAWNDLRGVFCDAIPSFQDDYWNSHYDFESESRDQHLSLIGEDLKKEMLINTVLPLIQEPILRRANPEELKAFDEFYMSFPASKTGKSRYLVHRFFGDTPKGALLNRACTEQGAYQLHRDFCLHYEASCEGCPFVERYKHTFS